MYVYIHTLTEMRSVISEGERERKIESSASSSIGNAYHMSTKEIDIMSNDNGKRAGARWRPSSFCLILVVVEIT